MNAGQDERRAETGLAGRQYVEGRRLAGERVETTPKIAENLVWHPGAHAACIDELAVIGAVAQEPAPEMRPRYLRQQSWPARFRGLARHADHVPDMGTLAYERLAWDLPKKHGTCVRNNRAGRRARAGVYLILLRKLRVIPRV